jgi:hypothetical protein
MLPQGFSSSVQQAELRAKASAQQIICGRHLASLQSVTNQPTDPWSCMPVAKRVLQAHMLSRELLTLLQCPLPPQVASLAAQTHMIVVF